MPESEKRIGQPFQEELTELHYYYAADAA